MIVILVRPLDDLHRIAGDPQHRTGHPGAEAIAPWRVARRRHESLVLGHLALAALGERQRCGGGARWSGCGRRRPNARQIGLGVGGGRPERKTQQEAARNAPGALAVDAPEYTIHGPGHITVQYGSRFRPRPRPAAPGTLRSRQPRIPNTIARPARHEVRLGRPDAPRRPSACRRPYSAGSIRRIVPSAALPAACSVAT